MLSLHGDCRCCCAVVSTEVNYILDEIVMAGMVLETNADLILTSIKAWSQGLPALGTQMQQLRIRVLSNVLSPFSVRRPRSWSRKGQPSVSEGLPPVCAGADAFRKDSCGSS